MPRLTYVRLAGGLGNQLFQLAASLALSGYGQRPVLLWTQSLYKYHMAREFSLVRLIDLPKYVSISSEPGMASLANFLRFGRILPVFGVNDRNFSAQAVRAGAGKINRSLFLDGYFQAGWDWAAFDKARDLLAKAVRLVTKGAANEFDCVLHIRGGDFLTSPHAHILDNDFYRRALAELMQLREVDSVYVVTDDVNHAHGVCNEIARTFSQLTLHIPERPQSMVDDFQTVLCSKARILGNSTFSWWAAALDQNRAITISPDRWTAGRRRDLILPWEVSLPVKYNTDR